MGYVPGMAGLSFGAGLGRDIRTEQEAQSKAAKGIGKWGSKKGLLGMLGSKALDFVGTKGLTAMLAGTGLGPLAPFVAKAITKGGGHLLGQALAGKGPEVGKSKTGLLGSGYDKLRELKGGIDESLKGQALGAAGSAFTGEAWKGLSKSGIGKAVGQLGLGNIGQDLMSPEMMSEIDKAKGSDMYQNAFPNLLNSFQEGGSTFNVDYDSISDYAKNMRENRKEDDFLGFMESPDIANALAGELTLRRDYKTTPEERAGIERTTANRERMQGIMQMLDMDKSLGSSPVDDTESAYLKSLSGSDTMGRQAHRLAYGDASTTTGPSAIDDTESAYLKSLSGSDVMGKQATRFSEAQDVYGSPSLDDSESSYLKSLQGSNRLGDLANLEQMRQGIGQARDASMDYEWLRQLWDTGEQGGISPQYAQQQRTILGMQMGGMPGVSSPIPYQDGGYLRQYNLGGSVAQQPLSYQLGGLLKYKRSPVS